MKQIPLKRTFVVDLNADIEICIDPAPTESEIDSIVVFIDLEGELQNVSVPIRDLEGWFDTDVRTEAEKRASVAQAFRELADRIERG